LSWFLRDRRLADFAVRKTSELLKRHGYENNIVNTKGYDLVLGDGRKVEVKFDTVIYDSGNIACEWWSDKPSRTPGWVQYSDADIMVYMYDFDNAYVVDMQKLKEYVKANLDKLPSKPPYRGKGGSQAEVKLLPIEDVPQLRMKEFEEAFTRNAVLPPRERVRRSQP